MNDLNGQREHAAYLDLVRRHRAVAADLEALAQQMRSYRDLPMAAHDMAVMLDPNGQMAAFTDFVSLERELVTFLQAKLQDDAALLSSDH